MIKTLCAAVAAGFLGLVAVGPAQAQSGPIDVIEVRQAGQDLLAGSFAGIATASAANADLKPFRHGRPRRRWARYAHPVSPAATRARHQGAARRLDRPRRVREGRQHPGRSRGQAGGARQGGRCRRRRQPANRGAGRLQGLPQDLQEALTPAGVGRGRVRPPQSMPRPSATSGIVPHSSMCRWGV